MNLRTWTISLGLILAPHCSGCVLAAVPLQPIERAQLSRLVTIAPLPDPMPIAAAPTSPKANKKLGKTLKDQLGQCVVKKSIAQRKFSMEQIQAASMECMFEVVLLTPDGKTMRPDANERMVALVQYSGMQVPIPDSQGQAAIKLKPLSGSRVFTVNVRVGQQSQPFLLDTGASASIVEHQMAKQLKLKGTRIPDRLMSYMVIGEKCTGINASLYPLPEIAVDAAKVRGLMGMGLPQRFIPGQVSGVLGLDFLSNYDVVLNPKTSQLQLWPPSQAAAGAIPLTGKLGVMTAPVYINGKGPFIFGLDTGADLMVLSTRLANKLGLNVKKAPEITVTGFCGTAKGRRPKLAQVQIQNYSANQLDAVVLPNSSPLDLLGVDGLVGQNYLNQYRQHWRFGARDALGNPASGSLELSTP